MDVLREHPLPTGTPLINRDNAVSILLRAFPSNNTVKALVVLPEVSDDFYLIHRDAPKLNLRATNFLDALVQLTNATGLRLTFDEPFLLLHLPGDSIHPDVIVKDAAADRLMQQRVALRHEVYVDAHWEKLQPQVAKHLNVTVQPEAASPDAWHFARHNFAGWNLTGSELLRVLSLTGNTTVTVQKSDIRFRERVRE
ncbi:MAG: hypothetical protein QOF48_2628 [Verrucomicrobiota bacterium]|jgi:hypothetical protein